MSDLSRQFTLGPWRVDVPGGLVVGPGGEERRLCRRAMMTLVVLAEAAGGVVSKQALVERVWRDAIVTENSLNQAISEIRRVLGDERGRPRYVETLHGRGYRLLATPGESRPTEPGRRSARASWAFAAGAVLLIGAALVWRPDSESRFARQVSPDGQRIAYFAERDGSATLYVAARGAARPRPITEIEVPDSYALAWSNDGSRLVFNTTRERAPFYSVEVQRVDGGDPLYLKFAKDPARHAADSVPADLLTATQTVDVEEWARGSDKVHRVDLYGERLVILFTGGRITAFSWPSLQAP